MYRQKLNYLRDRKEITKQAMAEVLKIDRTTYSHYEKEDDIMPLKYLNVICYYFDISLDYIFGFSDKTSYTKNKKNIDTKIAGLRLKEFRKEMNFTQKELSEKLSIANTMISKYEKGEYLISTHALYDICKKYNISADYLLGKIDSPKYIK